MAAINVQPRDVVFTFNNSCNCCFLCCPFSDKYSKDDDVYITSSGTIERFNMSKAKENINVAFERAKTNLLTALNKRLGLIDNDHVDFYLKARETMESIDALGKINIAHMDSINDLMLGYLRAKIGEQSPKDRL